ncbi:ATP-binding protein [Saccharibacillus sp. CPCC 101409]|uniref:AAA family ATPase n=1 Tax=Saccharibacillus sp. CPCC 101409 TaxID=3058041 RepID=UPI002674092A|nr:ATP-binding protein [Saccharibacillus sp. CPCC 101409]MDO3409479.1 ATP-binding protein [Saccharibacillus sp. CPCC 101409]
MGKSTAAARLPRSKGTDMATVYEPKDCARKVRHLVLPGQNRRIVEEFMTILEMREEFDSHGVPIPNKIVMYGPPGTGKTLTAFHIAASLGLPLVLVRLDALIHSHLGETGSNIRRIFDYARSVPCVLFLDEFDAVARTRESGDEVKEMARAVNTLLQCLDEFGDGSVFVAATNLETELDAAIWRRFDTRMTYRMPDEGERCNYIRLLIGEFACSEDAEASAAERLCGCSFADIEQILLKAKRKAIIERAALSREHVELAYREYAPEPAERKPPRPAEAPQPVELI